MDTPDKVPSFINFEYELVAFCDIVIEFIPTDVTVVPVEILAFEIPYPTSIPEVVIPKIILPFWDSNIPVFCKVTILFVLLFDNTTVELLVETIVVFCGTLVPSTLNPGRRLLVLVLLIVFVEIPTKVPLYEYCFRFTYKSSEFILLEVM